MSTSHSKQTLLKRTAKLEKELAAKSYGLKIESALEKVSIAAMSMKKPKDLSGIGSLIFKELKKLGFTDLRNSEIIINNDAKETITSYYYSDYGVTGVIELDYKSNAIVKGWADQLKKASNAFAEVVIPEKEMKAWRKYREEIGYLPDRKLNKAKTVYYYSYSTGTGALSISSFKPVSKEQIKILKRFRNVFQLSYRRYIDIAKAEVQAKEAAIELALEKVRAKTMAMQKSEELQETTLVLFQQFKSLGVTAAQVSICVFDEDTRMGEMFVTLKGEKIERSFPMELDKEVFVMKKAKKAFLDKRKKFSFIVKGKELQDYNHWRNSLIGRKGWDESNAVRKQSWYVNGVFFSRGLMGFSSDMPSTDETLKLLDRFAGVFDLTFTRFLDLQKAEAQARESQIQLALERVRARTMAMHKSEELAETAQVMFYQLQELGGIPDRIAIGVADEAEGVVNFWSTDQLGSHINNSFKARLDERTVISKTYQVWKDQKKSLVIDLHGEELKEWLRFAREEMGIAVKDEFIKDRRVHNLAFFSHGWLLVTTHEPQSAETIQILERFAAVFSLTYRRFLDLQRAEAQAREAQIEAALERVRARSMAMHHSSELHDAADVLFQQLRLFGGNILNAGIALCTQDADEDEYWLSSVSGLRPVILIPHTEDPIQKKLYEDWKNKAEFYSIAKGGDALRAHYDYLRSVPHLKPFFEEGPDWSYPTWQKWHAAFFSHGYLFMITLEPYEEEKILVRFARVFEQAYTRFLDLKRAEAQASEAQLESALEKVRSRSLAMHKSDELQEVVNTVFERLKELDVEMDSANIAIFKEGTRDYDYWIASPVQKRSAVFHMPYIDPGISKDLMDARDTHTDVFLKTYSFEEKNEWFERSFQKTDFKFLDEQRKKFILEAEGITVAIAFAKNTGVQVNRYSSKSLTEDEIDTLKRFSKVFEQAYIRFLDLQKAEEQAREAQIETSLERVRSRTMAMHNSNDVGETVATMFAEFVHLGIHTNRCGILIFSDQYVAEVWTARATPGGNAKLIIGKLDLDAHKMLRFLYNAWKAKETFYQYDLLDDDLVQYYNAINNSRFYPTQFDLNALPSKEFNSAFFFTDGGVFSFTNEPVAEEHAKIIKRFASVFGQTYRRYLDLQKAEAQTRESQIQLSLERVRARTMAMHKSEELAEVAEVLYNQLKDLGDDPERITIGIMSEDNRVITWWATDQGGSKLNIRFQATADEPTVMLKLYDSWKAKHTSLVIDLTGPELSRWVKYCREVIGVPINEEILQDRRVQAAGFFSHGCVMITSPHRPDAETINILERFATVFDLTYRRFLDLQKAEAQAREAQIETSLERVRSKTMAMHNSDDVTSAIATMFTELDRLGIENMRCGIAHYLEDHKMEVWSVSNLADGKVVRGAGLLDTNSIPFWKIFYSTWQKKEDFLYYLMAGKEKEDYFKKISTLQNYLSQTIEDVPDLSIQTYYFPEGSVWAFSLKPHSEEDKQVMKRFASVFSLTFRRYQDLKRAEAQAREATIEAALEKVRGKAMAMHNSNDLSVTTSMVFTELRKLGINPIRCGVGLLNKESKKSQLYSATSSADGDSLSLVGWVILSEHPVLEKIYESWLDDEEYYPQLQGEQMRSYYQLLLKGLPVTAPQVEDDKKQYGHFLPFSVGCLYAWSEVPYDETEIKILKRFATIIDLTFRRYMELQTSEANAREAVKQAALDRVRAEIASMRTVADLDRITPLIWNELTILGLPFIRCGIFLMDDSQQLIHTFLSTPDGKAIGAFHLPYDTPGNFSVMLRHWLDKETYISRWDEVDFIGIAEVLVQQGSIATREQYLSSLPKGGFYLHFLPFLQGMLYVGNTKQLGEEEIELTQHVADAFSTAYARYEDFNKLEAAKQQVEKTLTDLKQAQTQLVQSEKMASLGELTAGIAHEIQNPLNFVNNFSDVSNELLDEMKEELAKGNIDDAIAIAEDVKQNLEKINHHGKRADGIVKGMLQHSRTSSGQKEMTDINVLADEYLRLAYHGLRAKEKSFNAKFETDFDKNVGEINIIPQDIGRVILNLINNAFYAVSERKKAAGGGFEPTVTISTASIQPPLGGRSIQIKVADNGGGIPQKVIDKIFQPFFTTKPTGQGTGLGLSLAYDIIKAHGGEIKVETKDGEGSEFIIQLPIV